jgi:broad specificity phosphatase PhoE
MNPLILIRHGHAEHLTGELTGGWTDTELTELGRHQAEALASRLEDELADAACRMYCSDLKRAAQTAGIIGDALGLKPTPARGLKELQRDRRGHDEGGGEATLQGTDEALDRLVVLPRRRDVAPVLRKGE